MTANVFIPLVLESLDMLGYFKWPFLSIVCLFGLSVAVHMKRRWEEDERERED